MNFIEIVIPVLFSLASAAEVELQEIWSNEGALAHLGDEAQGEAVSLDSLIESGARHDGKAVVTEGELWLEFEDHSLCPAGRTERGLIRDDCLWLDLAWKKLGGSERVGLKVLEQWNGYRVRVGGVFRPGPSGHFGLYGGRLESSSMTLLEKPKEPIYGVDEIDQISPPESPNVWGRRPNPFYRCGPTSFDSNRKLVCLDLFEPWVWVETEDGFLRTEYEEPVADFSSWVTTLELVDENRFIAVFDDSAFYDEASPVTLFGWDGQQFVLLGRNVVYSPWTFEGSRYYFAEVDRGESGESLESRVAVFDASFRPQIIWRKPGVEVVEFFEAGPDQAEIEFVEDGTTKYAVVGGQWLGASHLPVPD